MVTASSQDSAPKWRIYNNVYRRLRRHKSWNLILSSALCNLQRATATHCLYSSLNGDFDVNQIRILIFI